MAESNLEPSFSPRWSRRKLLVYGTAGLAGAGVVGLRMGSYANKTHFSQLRHLTATSGAILYAVTDAMLPAFADRSPAQLRRYVRRVDDYLLGMPPEDILQLQLLLVGIEQAPFVAGLYFRRFSRLSRADRQAVLHDWQTSRIGLRKLGLQSLKALIFLAYYRTPEAFRAIDYSGPIAPGFAGPSPNRERYDKLLAPNGQWPSHLTKPS